LGRAASDDTWVQWTFDWTASPGKHRLRVRAIDGDDEVQIEDSAPPAPDGATGYHARTIRVA
jgi:hypothetical protein